jgi:hypothetical protein
MSSQDSAHVICFDGDSDNDELEILSVVTPARSEHSTAKKVPNSSASSIRKGGLPLLKFSVSKNSGRFAIHSAETAKPFLVNFDVQDVISKDTADVLMEAQVKRLSNPKTRVHISFDDLSVNRVLGPIMKQLSTEREESDVKSHCCQELKDFVSIFMSFREIEKQVVKESGDAFSSVDLRQSVMKLMVTSVKESTERYNGGAKERATENFKNGKASEVDLAVLDKRACAWCAGPLPITSMAAGVEATYCSRSCAESGRLRRGGMYASTRIREQLFALEGGICRNCGINAHALFVRISALQPAERLNALCNANWTLPKTSAALERLLQDPKEGDFWEADHVQAVSEGGGDCMLDNLQTLCKPCHKTETERLMARLRLTGKPTDKSSSGEKRKQIDIRSAFFANSQPKSKKNK